MRSPDDICANCKSLIWSNDPDGVSSLYSPDQEFILCEPCWLAEEAEIERRGTNDIPELVAHYATPTNT